VTNSGDNTVSVIDGATNTVATTIAVAPGPRSVSVDAAFDTVFVVNQDASAVSVIDGATNTVTTTIAVGTFPFGVAVNEATHVVYVTSTSDNTVSVIKPLTASLHCSTGTSGGQPSLSCTAASTIAGVALHYVNVADLTNRASFIVGTKTPCRAGGIANPQTLTVPASPGHRYKVTVTTCAGNKTTFKVAPDGTVTVIKVV
jgi:YVTN family beta-propeller protein